MDSIFINKNCQTRSGWKIALTIFVFLALTIGVNLVFMVDNAMIGNIIQCICLMLSVFIFWKLFERRPIREMGLINIRSGYRDLIIGLVFGSISMSSVFLLLLTTGSITLEKSLYKPNFSISLMSGLILFIFVGLDEEIFTRGYCMSVLSQTGRKWMPLIGSSILFALMHSMNPHMSLLSYINLFLVGLLLAYMFIKSKNIWITIGYHITWNYFEGSVFGFQVSGENINSVYTVNTPANNLITGGQFGPEAGIMVTIVIMLGFLYMWKFYKPIKGN